MSTMKKYQAWQTESGVAFFATDALEQMSNIPGEGLLKMLYEFEAATAEEASSIHNLRMGFGPYEPIGDPQSCPNCGAWFYPEGSGECWRCGKVC